MVAELILYYFSQYFHCIDYNIFYDHGLIFLFTGRSMHRTRQHHHWDWNLRKQERSTNEAKTLIFKIIEIMFWDLPFYGIFRIHHNWNSSDKSLKLKNFTQIRSTLLWWCNYNICYVTETKSKTKWTSQNLNNSISVKILRKLV